MGERSPEKAGVGGSIPSLATIKSVSYRPSKNQFHSDSFQKLWSAETRISDENGVRIVLNSSRFRPNSMLLPGSLERYLDTVALQPGRCVPPGVPCVINRLDTTNWMDRLSELWERRRHCSWHCPNRQPSGCRGAVRRRHRRTHLSHRATAGRGERVAATAGAAESSEVIRQALFLDSF